jgi:hypothetical protein
VESLSRLIHTFTEQDLSLMETLIKKKKRGTLSFKKPAAYAKAIADPPEKEEEDDDEDDYLEFKKDDMLKIIRMDHLTGLWLCEFNSRVFLFLFNSQKIGYVPNILLTTNIKQNESVASVTSTDYDNKTFRAKSYLKSFDSLERQSFQSFFQEKKTSSGKVLRTGVNPSNRESYMMYDHEDEATKFEVNEGEFFKKNEKVIVQPIRPSEQVVKKELKIDLKEVEEKKKFVLSEDDKTLMSPSRMNSVLGLVSKSQSMNGTSLSPNSPQKKSKSKSSNNLSTVSPHAQPVEKSEEGSQKKLSKTQNLRSLTNLSPQTRSSQVSKLISTFEKFGQKNKSQNKAFGDDYVNDCIEGEEVISNSGFMSFSKINHK